MIIFAIGSSASVVVGLVQNFGDGGGTFIRIWFTVAGTYLMLVAATSTRWKTALGWALLPAALFVPVATLYFAPQAVFPFALFVVLMLGLCWLVDRRSVVVVLWICILFLTAQWMRYGIRQMAMVHALRTLGETTSMIEIAGPESAVRITDRDAIARIAVVLRETKPYAPNHESARNQVRVTIHRLSEAPIMFGMDRGNRADPQAAWIHFDVCSYQNTRLYEVLESEHALPTKKR